MLLNLHKNKSDQFFFSGSVIMQQTFLDHQISCRGIWHAWRCSHTKLGQLLMHTNVEFGVFWGGICFWLNTNPMAFSDGVGQIQKNCQALRTDGWQQLVGTWNVVAQGFPKASVCHSYVHVFFFLACKRKVSVIDKLPKHLVSLSTECVNCSHLWAFFVTCCDCRLQAFPCWLLDYSDLNVFPPLWHV